jgi:inner membrane protein
MPELRSFCAAAGALKRRNCELRRCDIIIGMPSPIGHALAGIAVGALIARPPGWRLLAVTAVAAALPDMDFLLPLRHRGPSHSVGAAAMAFAVALLVLSSGSHVTRRWHSAAAVGLAYASHTLLDWLGADTSTPRGLMALWPLSTAFYISGWDVFDSVDRRYWMPGFWTRNTIAVLREIAILGPIVILALLARHRRTG